uniref:Uncharacterized protein n=1 Tax=Ditylenchus dipsaci TaxID=166011 RepID=A0A915D7B8_9BILA
MSSKKKKVVSQCNSCGCFFLAKDFQEHTAGPNNLASTPRTTGANAHNPRTVLKSAAAQPSKLASPASNVVKSGCKKTSFSDSCVQIIEPKHGMMAVEQTIDKRASFLPTEILGWQKYHAALVNPESLRQLECAPRSVAIIEVCDSTSSKSEPAVESSSSESILVSSQTRLCTLWPCSEVPHLRISLPTNGVDRSRIPGRSILLWQESIENSIEKLRLGSTLPQIYHVSVDANFIVCWEAEDLR